MDTKRKIVGVFLVILFMISLACKKSTSPSLPDSDDNDTPTQQTADFYVSPQGSDGNNGTSPSSAFKTLKKALDVVHSGQVIEILAGTYHEEIELYRFGKPDATIVIRGSSEGTRPVFDGENSMKSFMYCHRCTHITIEHLTIRNYRWEGIYFELSQVVTFQDNHFEHTGFDISDNPDTDGGVGLSCIECKDVRVQGNTFHRIGAKNLQKEQSGNAILFWGTQNSIIENNTIENTIGTGILVEDSCHITVTQNTIRFSDLRMLDWFDGGIWVDGGMNITLEKNTLEQNDGPAIEISDSEVQYPHRARSIVVQNNIIKENSIGLYIWNYGQCPPPENAVRLEDNTLQGNSEQNLICHEWVCGTNSPCVSPDNYDPC